MPKFLVHVAAALAITTSLGGCGARPGSSPVVAPSNSAVHPVSFDSNGLRFDALIETPSETQRNGWAVLMIGGGLGNDLNWVTPGTLGGEGQTNQVTISGASHADAPRISEALASEGFTVMRWSTIAQGDPLADQWPVRATPRTLAELTEQTRAALAELRDQPMVRHDQVILLGFSLGAARACTMAAEDESVAALILLSPAYFTRPAKPPASFEANGMRFGAEVLEARSPPTLLVFGELDESRSVDRIGTEVFAQEKGARRVTIRSMPGLGHQLGPQEGDRIGPIDAQVTRMVAEWAVKTVAGAGGGL